MSATVQTPPHSNPKLAQEERKQRLQRIVRKGLPPFPQTALELAKILRGNSPDVQKAGKLICADPTLSSQVLRMYLAQRRRYFEKDQAYIAGLLHDIGQVPQWMLVIEDKGKTDNLSSDGWADNPSFEREYFGVSHCELGGTMAGFWDLMPSFVDVLNNHHTPELAKHDSLLVRIVATIEFFLLAQDAIQSSLESSAPPVEDAALLESLQKMKRLGEGLFGEDEWPNIEGSLEDEYTRRRPLVQTGLKGVLARGDD